MALNFTKDEPAAQGIRRMALEQVRMAQDELNSPETDPHEAVHQARKRFKKLRALLRLVRTTLGAQYAEENALFRDLGRRLSAIRDAEAMVETFDAISKRFSRQLDAGMVEDLRRALVARREELDAAHPLAEQVRAVRETLAQAVERIPQWPLEDTGFSLLGPGFQRIYGQGAKARKRAMKTGEAADFHEWRKRVKDHWYHARMLQRVWPDVLPGYSRALKQLSDLLGDHHNLVVFRELLFSEEALAAAADREVLLGLIDREHQRLEAASIQRGALVYAEPAGAITHRFACYWNAWHKND